MHTWPRPLCRLEPSAALRSSRKGKVRDLGGADPTDNREQRAPMGRWQGKARKPIQPSTGACVEAWAGPAWLPATAHRQNPLLVTPSAVSSCQHRCRQDASSPRYPAEKPKHSLTEPASKARLRAQSLLCVTSFHGNANATESEQEEVPRVIRIARRVRSSALQAVRPLAWTWTGTEPWRHLVFTWKMPATEGIKRKGRGSLVTTCSEGLPSLCTPACFKAGYPLRAAAADSAGSAVPKDGNIFPETPPRWSTFPSAILFCPGAADQALELSPNPRLLKLSVYTSLFQ
ncbi:hypothetical protein H920_06729 [Fukomys damarensis]|uniref:Uncharacterized protein n=1 Tax=Fukomys damarensis TaxID=885580 RepID=A0A091DMZ7_FUKDA|nr:hypothetical protein H920_06729 [Fukomys damarensis]